MLISGSQVLAIDKVKRDNTLTGDGQFVPLGVHSAFMKKDDADKLYQPKGDYPERSWIQKNYYTNSYCDKTFAKIGDSYTKTESDYKFQPVGDYVSATEFTDLSSSIDKKFYNKTEVDNKLKLYVSAEQFGNAITVLNNTIYTTSSTLNESISAVLDDLTEHENNYNMHLDNRTREMIEDISKRDLSKYLSHQGAATGIPLNLFVSENRYDWIPAITPIAGTGLTAVDNESTSERTFSLSQDTLDILEAVSAQSEIIEGLGISITEKTNGVEIAAKEMIGVTVDEDGNIIAGVPGLVPTPTEMNRFLRSDGQWVHVEGGGGGTSVEFTTTTAGLVDDVVYFFVKELPE